VLLKGGLRDATLDDALSAGMLLGRGLCADLPADNRLLAWMLLLHLIRVMRDPAHARCTELAALLPLFRYIGGSGNGARIDG
jgi:hypothetical protein